MRQLVITSWRARLTVTVAMLAAAVTHSARPMAETAMPTLPPDVPTLYLQDQPWCERWPSL